VDASSLFAMPHTHQLDLALVCGALVGDRFPYVGLIGSKAKRRRFEKRLAAAGIPPTPLSELVCPLGIPGLETKLPAAIAAAPVAELVIRDEALRLSSADSAAADPR